MMAKPPPDLFDYVPPPLPEPRGAYARHSDPETSKAAAAKVKVNPLEQSALAALRQYGPMTSPEIAEKAGISIWSISPRMKPLEKKGLVKRSGTKPRPDGGSALTLWKATDGA